MGKILQGPKWRAVVGDGCAKSRLGVDELLERAMSKAILGPFAAATVMAPDPAAAAAGGGPVSGDHEDKALWKQSCGERRKGFRQRCCLLPLGGSPDTVKETPSHVVGSATHIYAARDLQAPGKRERPHEATVATSRFSPDPGTA